MSDTVILRKVYAVNSNTGTFLSTNQLLNPDGKGGTTWMPIISSLTVAGGPIVGDLPSTLSTTSSLVYSSLTEISSLWSTTNALSTALYSLSPGNVDPADLVSTVDGLGNAGYISSTQLTSTVTGLRNEAVSTVSSLGTLGYVSTSWLNSTINGLGSTYVSSASVASSLTSSITGLANVAYVSSTWLNSTVTGLGTLGYISSSWLTSTVNGLGTFITATSGYVSTATLNSTVTSLLARPVNFNTVTDCTVNTASSVTITNATNVYYGSSFYIGISSFYMSSCAVTGTFGTQFGMDIASASNVSFSTATFNLSNFTPLLSSNSRFYVEYTPTFVFSAIYVLGVFTPLFLTMTTQLQYGTTLLPVSTANTLYCPFRYEYLSNAFTTATASTIVEPIIKLAIPNSITQTLVGTNSNLTFVHKITGGFAGGGHGRGFQASSITVFCPTSSIFIGLQNQLL